MSERITNAGAVTAGRAPRWVTMFGGVAKRVLAAGVPLGFQRPDHYSWPDDRDPPRTTPVAIIDVSGRQWNPAPWGDVQLGAQPARGRRRHHHRSPQVGGGTATELDRAQRVVFFRDVLDPAARAIPFGSQLHPDR